MSQQLWIELHKRALKNNGEDDNEYLATFSLNVPRYTKGCKCSEYWVLWVKYNPPVYGKEGEYFEWSVRAHNAVNAKLNKRQYTVEEAKAFYS